MLLSLIKNSVFVRFRGAYNLYYVKYSIAGRQTRCIPFALTYGSVLRVNKVKARKAKANVKQKHCSAFPTNTAWNCAPVLVLVKAPRENSRRNEGAHLEAIAIHCNQTQRSMRQTGQVRHRVQFAGKR
jgi:hypothetical protein